MKTREKQKSNDETYSLNYFSLYRYATKWDVFVISVGVISIFVKSLVMLGSIICIGEFTTLLVDRTLGTGTTSPTIFISFFGGGKILKDASVEENRAEIKNDSIAYMMFSSTILLIQFIVNILSVDCFNRTALRQITRIRIKYFKSLLSQEIGWYDVEGGSSNFAVRVTDDIEKIREGISEQVGQFIYLIMSFAVCITASFIYGWKLSLILISYIPIVFIVSTMIGKMQASLTTRESKSYSLAANVVEEVLSGIRTVFAFGGEKVEIERYNKRLVNSKKAVKRRGLLSGFNEGTLRFLSSACTAIGCWFGVQFVLHDRGQENPEYTPTVMMLTFMSVYNGAGSLKQIGPFLELFASACGSARQIFRVIDRAPKIDSLSNEGKIIQFDVRGKIQFKSVDFSYPSRPDVQILSQFDMEILSGQSVALVGHSGNGKSTCLQLLQRFYDPDEGGITIDGCDIRSLNINVLRSNIATVGQEPVLFSTTIGENIRYGNPDATDEDVIEAARNSGAHDFIAKLPRGYNTLVGEKGSQLSGGQKQRISIARALIQDPKILLLDEATSALDYQSEKYVQETLDRVSKGRTTIVVSHRLSAIRDADRILFIEKGHVIEDGTHSELMALKGQYYEMVTAGGMKEETEEEFDENKNKPYENREAEQRAGLEQLKSEQEGTGIIGFQGLNALKMEEEVESKVGNISYWNRLKRLLKLSKPEQLTSTRCCEEESDDDSDENEDATIENHEIKEKLALKRILRKQKQDEKNYRGSVDKVEKVKKLKVEEIAYWNVIKRIVKLAKPEWPIMAVASISSICIAVSTLINSLIFADVYGALAIEDEQQALDTTVFLSFSYVGVGILMFIAGVSQAYWFTAAGVDLTTRLRSMTFAALLRQECGWFDEKDHTSSALNARLTGDTASLQRAMGNPLSIILQGITAFIMSVCIAFYYSVELSLLNLAAFPFSIGSVIIEAKYMAKGTFVEKQTLEIGTKIASEAITNIRTVASLRQERFMIERYDAEMMKVESIVFKKIMWRGLVTAFAQTIPIFGQSLVFAYGSYSLVANGEMHFKNIIKVFQVLLRGSILLAQTFVVIPSLSSAFVGAHRLFQIIDREPMITSPDVTNKNQKPDSNSNIEYKKIDFRYPTRPDVQILKDFNLNVIEGKTIALVGPSGCGKSTVIQLLQRLYDPDNGSIHIGSDEVSTDLTLAGLRSKLSIVSQEPVLFDKTIAENIAYGDNSREVSMEEIIAAARVANIHDFINKLPLGYETDVGSKSAQLSGGQKQRIAIARALIRNPKILLLDEATSALDLQSEQVVQQALDTAQSGRTCLVIAHRLSTVQNADAICVVRNGSIVEYGTHNELLDLNGIYSQLYNAQM